MRCGRCPGCRALPENRMRRGWGATAVASASDGASDGIVAAKVRSQGRRLHRFVTAVFFLIAERAVRATGFTALPPPLIGLVVLFSILLALEKSGSADSVFNALEPGYRFLVKWSMLFFIPALVKIPLVEEDFTSGVVVRLCLLMAFGFVTQCLAVAGVASVFAPLKEEDESSAPAKAASSAAAKAEEGAAGDMFTSIEPYPRPGVPYKRRWLPVYGVAMLISMLAYRIGVVPGIAEQIYMLCAMLLAFVGAQNAPKAVKTYAHPIFVCVAGSWAAAMLWAAQAGPSVGFKDVLTHYSAATGAGTLVAAWLGPLVVALALLLYERRHLLKSDMVPIVSTSAIGAATGLFGTAVLARILALPKILAVSSLPRCVTAPLAMGMTAQLHGSASLTVPMVIFTGFLGAMFGGGLLQGRSDRARGLAMGASAHGLGTAALAMTDTKAFPYGALSFVLVGGFSAIYVALPPVRAVLLWVLGV